MVMFYSFLYVYQRVSTHSPGSPVSGDGGALGALTALATQAAVQSNVQHLGIKKHNIWPYAYAVHIYINIYIYIFIYLINLLFI